MRPQRYSYIVKYRCLRVTSLTNAVSAPGKLHTYHLYVYIETYLITATKCISKVSLPWPARVESYSLYCALLVRTVVSSKCISKLIFSQSPNLHHHSLQVSTIIASKVNIAKLAQSWPPSASLNSLDYGLQVYFQTCSIRSSKTAQAWHPTVAWNTPDHGPDHGPGMHLIVHWIVIVRYTSNSSPTPPEARPDIRCVDG